MENLLHNIQKLHRQMTTHQIFNPRTLQTRSLSSAANKFCKKQYQGSQTQPNEVGRRRSCHCPVRRHCPSTLAKGFKPKEIGMGMKKDQKSLKNKSNSRFLFFFGPACNPGKPHHQYLGKKLLTEPAPALKKKNKKIVFNEIRCRSYVHDDKKSYNKKSRLETDYDPTIEVSGSEQQQQKIIYHEKRKSIDEPIELMTESNLQQKQNSQINSAIYKVQQRGITSKPNNYKSVLFKEQTEINCVVGEDHKLADGLHSDSSSITHNEEEHGERIVFKRKTQSTNKAFKTLKSLKSLASNITQKTINSGTGSDDLDITSYIEGKRGVAIGKGSSGVVWKLRVPQLGTTLALKRINMNKKQNQVEIMTKLSEHPFIVPLYDVFQIVSNNGYSLQLVMKYFSDKDLGKKLRKEGTFSIRKVKIYAYQIFRGLHFIHNQGIMHCDIKCQNIFAHRDKLAIGDFGSAQFVENASQDHGGIGIQENRPPEIVLGNKSYSQKGDIWAAGCVICRMLLGHPLFQLNDGQDHFIQIMRILGTPSRLQFEVLRKNRCWRWQDLPKQVPRKKWTQVFQEFALCPLLANFLDKLFEYDPQNRYSALEALCHPYFDEIRVQAKYRSLHTQFQIEDNFFLFHKEELPQQLKNKLIPGWVPEDMRQSQKENSDFE